MVWATRATHMRPPPRRNRFSLRRGPAVGHEVRIFITPALPSPRRRTRRFGLAGPCSRTRFPPKTGATRLPGVQIRAVPARGTHGEMTRGAKMENDQRVSFAKHPQRYIRHHDDKFLDTRSSGVGRCYVRWRTRNSRAVGAVPGGRRFHGERSSTCTTHCLSSGDPPRMAPAGQRARPGVLLHSDPRTGDRVAAVRGDWDFVCRAMISVRRAGCDVDRLRAFLDSTRADSHAVFERSRPRL
jgi:hypothetical protein